MDKNMQLTSFEITYNFNMRFVSLKTAEINKSLVFIEIKFLLMPLIFGNILVLFQ